MPNGLLTPMYELGEYLSWTRSGEIQLPDFQRGYTWEDERTRQVIESRAQIKAARLDELLATDLIPAEHLRADAFDDYFAERRESLCQLVEAAIGKAVQRDVDEGFAEEDSSQFEPDEHLEETSTGSD